MVKLSFTFSFVFHSNHRYLKSTDLPKHSKPLKPSAAPLEVLFMQMPLYKVAFFPRLQTLSHEALLLHTALIFLPLSSSSLFSPPNLLKAKETPRRVSIPMPLGFQGGG